MNPSRPPGPGKDSRSSSLAAAVGQARLRLCTIGILLACLPVLQGAAPSEESATAGEAEIKARFLIQTISQTEWPTSTFESPESPIVLLIVGRDPFGPAKGAWAPALIGRRPLEIRHLANAREFQGIELSGRLRSATTAAEQSKSRTLRQCQVVFFAASEAGSMSRLLKTVDGRPILSVGETASFARRGGILNLAQVGGAPQIEINLDALRRSGLHVHSRLLGMAKLVSDNPGDRNR